MRGGDQRTVRVVVVDDSALLLETLVMALGSQPGIEVVGTALDGEQAIAVVRDARPDVVLLDLRLGDTWGLDLVPALRSGPAPTAVVVFSAASDPLTDDAATAAGAWTVVVKGAPIEEIAAALTEASEANQGDVQS